jgi:hypothetical protein
VYGSQGVQNITVPMALMIITINILCVSILARYGAPEGGVGAPPLVKALATNPLILACAAGLAINPLRIDWPGPVDTVFDWFGTAAIALGLFAVGAGLRPISGKGSGFAILAKQCDQPDRLARAVCVVALAVNLPPNWPPSALSARSRRRDIVLHPCPTAWRQRAADGADRHGRHRDVRAHRYRLVPPLAHAFLRASRQLCSARVFRAAHRRSASAAKRGVKLCRIGGPAGGVDVLFQLLRHGRIEGLSRLP